MTLRWPVARVVLILLILVGAVMVGIGVKALLDGRRFNATAVEARGAVPAPRGQQPTGLPVWRAAQGPLRPG